MHPILLEASFLKIYSYGALVALAFASAIYYCYKNVAKSGLKLSGEQVLSIATFLIIISMVGARLFYVVQYWPDLRGDWAAIFLLKEREGFVFYGGFIFGLGYLIWYCWQYRLDFWKFMDYIIPAGMLGYAIGRLGCFLNGCCYGARTDLPWGVIFPHHPGELRHPTQLYEMLFGLAFFFILKYWREHKQAFIGQTFLLGIMAYALERFLVEMVRINPDYGFFTQAQWLSLLLLLGSGYFYWSRAKGHTRGR